MSSFPTTPPTEAAQPSALLSIDQNRTTVVDRIVGDWGDALVQSGAGVTPDQLREILNGLRADHLLAASLAGTPAGLRDVIANALTASAAVEEMWQRASDIVLAALEGTTQPSIERSRHP